MLRVTVDTNVLDRDLRRIREAAEGHDVEVLPTTVTRRELGMAALPENEPAVRESFVWDESRWDEAVFGDDSPAVYEAILAVVSSGSFPPPGRRENLTDGERRQLRDAMILEAHVRDRRDVFVSDDRKAFIGKSGEKRAKLEALCHTRIVTVDEFCSAGVESFLRG